MHHHGGLVVSGVGTIKFVLRDASKLVRVEHALFPLSLYEPRYHDAIPSYIYPLTCILHRLEVLIATLDMSTFR